MFKFKHLLPISRNKFRNGCYRYQVPTLCNLTNQKCNKIEGPRVSSIDVQILSKDLSVHISNFGGYLSSTHLGRVTELIQFGTELTVPAVFTFALSLHLNCISLKNKNFLIKGHFRLDYE